MMQRRGCLFCAAGLVLATASRSGGAQGLPHRRLGVLLFDAAASWDFLRRDLTPALAMLGWQEGRNLTPDWRFAEGDARRLPGLAQGLLRDGAQVLLTRGTPATRALQQATSTVPIVTGVGDPVGAGFAATLAAPGGNITGLSYALPESATKQIELLRELVPTARHLLLLMPASRAPMAGELVAPVERVARAQGLRPQLVLASHVQGLRQAVAAARQRWPKGEVVAYAFAFGKAMDLALAAQEERVPTVFDQRAYVDAGGLISYRLNWEDQTQRTAAQLDKVLRGVKPAQIPFELPTRTEFVINVRAAKALGLVVPAALLVRADEVIE